MRKIVILISCIVFILTIHCCESSSNTLSEGRLAAPHELGENHLLNSIRFSLHNQAYATFEWAKKHRDRIPDSSFIKMQYLIETTERLDQVFISYEKTLGSPAYGDSDEFGFDFKHSKSVDIATKFWHESQEGGKLRFEELLSLNSAFHTVIDSITYSENLPEKDLLFAPKFTSPKDDFLFPFTRNLKVNKWEDVYLENISVLESNKLITLYRIQIWENTSNCLSAILIGNC